MGRALGSAGPEMTEQEFPLHCVLFCDNVRSVSFWLGFFFSREICLNRQSTIYSELLEHSIKNRLNISFFVFVSSNIFLRQYQ